MLTDVHGRPIRDLASARVVSNAEAQRLRINLQINVARLRRLGLPESLACDCCRGTL